MVREKEEKREDKQKIQALKPCRMKRELHPNLSEKNRRLQRNTVDDNSSHPG